MASAERLPSGRWRGIYRTAEGKKRSKTFDHRRAAERWAHGEEQKVVEGSTRDPMRGRMRFGAWRETWWRARANAAQTEASAASKLRRHVAPRWDDVALNAITRLDLQTWVNDLVRAGYAAATVHACFRLLSNALAEAVRAGILDVNPATGLRLPRLPSAPERYLADHEVEALLGALAHPVVRGESKHAPKTRLAHPDYLALVELLLEGGLRLGEAIGLHRHRVDLAARTIDVVETWDPIDRLVKPHTKAGRRRTVPLSERLEDVLRRHLAVRPDAASCGLAHGVGSDCRSGLVFLGPHGAAIDGGNFTTRVYARALEDAGIGHARVHDLRHTWASRLVTGGLSLERLQKVGGWESYAMVLRYAHLQTEGHDEFRAALARNAGQRGIGRGTGRVSGAGARRHSGPDLRAL